MVQMMKAKAKVQRKAQRRVEKRGKVRLETTPSTFFKPLHTTGQHLIGVYGAGEGEKVEEELKAFKRFLRQMRTGQWQVHGQMYEELQVRALGFEIHAASTVVGEEIHLIALSRERGGTVKQLVKLYLGKTFPWGHSKEARTP